MRIRLANKNDIKFIQNLQKLVGPTELGFSEVLDDKELLDIFKDKLTFIALDKNKPIGFIIGSKIRPFGAMIANLAILPDYQKHLVGLFLIKYFEDMAIKRNILWILSYIKHTPTKQLIERNNRKYFIGDKYTEVLTVL
ncbi:MAG: GNAT family N-acetyltransferase [Alphaproteobacteria bacterium]|jgi:N-acetylglutamate synthase-like GNAT family acetyltransferase